MASLAAGRRAEIEHALAVTEAEAEAGEMGSRGSEARSSLCKESA